MSIFSYIRDLDKKFSWSFLGFFLAVIFGSITVYDRFIADKKPQLYFDILSNSSVLDIKEDIPSLDVIFENKNIKQLKLALSILTIKIFNDSTQDIYKNFIDPKDPIGVTISEGKIIKADVQQASSAYLHRNVVCTISDTSVLFPDIMIDGSDFFILKVLVLHPEGKTPTITPTGHIAGIKNIIIRNYYEIAHKPSPLKDIFFGSFKTQGVRVLVYGIVFFFFIFFFFVAIEKIYEIIKLILRKLKVYTFKKIAGENITNLTEPIFNLYLAEGDESLAHIHSTLNSHIKHPDRQVQVSNLSTHDPLNKCIKLGFVEVINDQIVISKHIMQTLDNFTDFLFINKTKFNNWGNT